MSSTKFICNLSDEHPDVQKQIGCMNGIFQLFDRNHFLGRSRCYVGQRRKRLPSPGQNGNHGTELKRASQNATEKDHKKSIKEKNMVSTKSSRTSFSLSSCSSNLSSLESTRATQLESSSFIQTITQESYRQDLPTYQSNASLLSSCQSPDIREVVKDSVCRETHGISVKTVSKGKAKGQTLKYIDSPRPLQHQKFAETKSAGRKESTGVHQIRDKPCKSNEGRSAFRPSLKDVRRLSLDERESRDAFKSSMKLKDFPRLSLDSKAGSVKGSTSEMTRNYLTQDVERNGDPSNFPNQQEPGSNRRQSSVVAKLMGLEVLPEPVSTNGNQEREFRVLCGLETDPCSQSSRTTNEKIQNRSAGSPRYLGKEPSSPQLQTADSVKKHTEKSKSSTEPAPWSQPDGSRDSPSPAFASQATPTKIQTSSVSVYGEIERQLAQLEFKKSGKDLRALKQILEAMQKSKEIFEIRSDALGCVSHISGNNHLDPSSKLESLRMQRSNNLISSSTMGTSSSESLKSPIVIMKPAKILGKASYSACQVNQTDDLGLHRHGTADSAGGRRKANKQPTSKNLIGTITKDPTPMINDLRNPASHPTWILGKRTKTKLVRLTPTTKEAQSTTTESTDLVKASRTINPRCLEKKIEPEQDSCPVTPSTALNSVKKQSNIDLTQPSLPRRKLRSKSPNLQLGGGVSSEGRDLSQHGDTISLVFENNVTTAFPVDEEVLSIDRSEKHIKTLIQQTCEREKEPEARLIEDKSNANPAITPSEQPSPVSVLDATFYNDELPSPIKRISISFKDDIYSDELGWNAIGACHSSSSMNSMNSSFVVDHERVENIMLLIQHMKQILPANEPITKELTLYNSTSLEHQYISETILASGFLKDFEPSHTATQPNPTAYPIANFFRALEQTKASIRRSNEESSENKAQPKLAKTQRKLLSDIVNELEKWTLESFSRMSLAPGIVVHKVLRELPLLQELSSEVDRLKSNHSSCSFDDGEDNLTRILWEDMMHQSLNWKSGHSEIPGLVLDIERLIFRDLISEVVTAERIYLQRRPA